MKKVVLLTGSEKTKEYPTTVKNMYWESHVFRVAYNYAKIIGDEIYILSPKYGLLSGDEFLEGEDEKIEEWSKVRRSRWGEDILEALAVKTDLKETKFEILAEKTYYEPIVKGLKYYKLPLENHSKMEWLPYIQKLIREEYSRFKELEEGLWSGKRMHKIVHTLPRYNYLDIEKIPFENGVYFMIDHSEIFFENGRIVRVGTHKGDGRLKERLKQHFMTENKEGSALRKYVGSAMLNQNKDEYLKIWQYKLRNDKIYRQHHKEINFNKERKIEKMVSEYLREQISFCCIEIQECNQRIEFKENIIRNLYKDEVFRASGDWLGRDNPKLHIGAYGLWNSELKEVCYNKEREIDDK